MEERMHSFAENNLLGSDLWQTAGIFSQGMTIKRLITKISDSTPAMTYKIYPENTSVTRLQYQENGWHLLSINDAAHLMKKPKNDNV